MREILRYAFILGIICVISAGLLSGVDLLTKPRIIAQARAEEEESLKEVVPQAGRFEEIKAEGLVYYKAYDEKGDLAGVAFKAKAVGYSSVIETMVGMTKGGKVIAIKVLSQNETPGLGSRVTEPGFTEQFKERDAAQLSGVEAISGATISSSALIDSIRERSAQIIKLIRDGR
ncbi:FMN-binding protein [Candidatus Omnitrophota bacterium]